jgi:hypothetical protein
MERRVCHCIYAAFCNFHWQNSGTVGTIKCFPKHIEHKTHSVSQLIPYVATKALWDIQRLQQRQKR